MKQIETISDKPILYDRTKKGYGIPVKGHRFYGMPELETALESLAVDLLTIGWLPHIEAFLSAGFQVSKGSAKNAHRLGIAWDWDGIVLVTHPFLVAAAMKQVFVYRDEVGTVNIDTLHGFDVKPLNQKAKTRAACLCSRHFGVVLGDFYDKHHEDHLHCDLSKPVGWRGSKSQIGLVQATLNAWAGSELKVDGILGPKTEEVFNQYTMWSPLKDHWKEFIDNIAMDR